ncbi:restriction endonuclease subunit S [Myroides sp. LoEW2-1]|uniref:restriction endonuclease subunit S n=1 Tax=Myroides sp. LoEW2-1 TaxID=2683192 RepID=UPI00132BFD39|nr:restriction endonuclease subunit S [Myroides sp. LoEW2-1]MVX34412.1 restriction endonuclease subunit S [Myroides sp. LoEW2-1]
MSKIDELIAKYCSDGVEWYSLESVFDIKNGYTPSKNDKENWENGDIPWFRLEDIRLSGKVLNDSIQHITKKGVKRGGLFPANSIILSTTATIGEHALITVPSLANQQFTYFVRKQEFDNILNIKFFFYYMFVIAKWCKSNVNEGGFAIVSTNSLKKYEFPIPPLPVQEEIVRILDKFTALEAELEAELEARTRQYEYYRNQLLSFEGKDVEWKALGDIGEFIRGKRFVRTDMIESGFPCIHYGEMYTYYNVFAKESKSFISEELAKKLRVANKGDVVIVAAGETIEDIGKATAWLGDSDVVIHDACFTFKSSLNPKFVAYFSRTKLFHDQIKRHISSGKISAINAKGLEKAKIPVPPLDEQERIVAILDKFDALVNGISTGLPAEIQARRQQYEYYRGKLLTFEPVAVAQ